MGTKTVQNLEHKGVKFAVEASDNNTWDFTVKSFTNSITDQTFFSKPLEAQYINGVWTKTPSYIPIVGKFASASPLMPNQLADPKPAVRDLHQQLVDAGADIILPVYLKDGTYSTVNTEPDHNIANLIGFIYSTMAMRLDEFDMPNIAEATRWMQAQVWAWDCAAHNNEYWVFVDENTAYEQGIDYDKLTDELYTVFGEQNIPLLIEAVKAGIDGVNLNFGFEPTNPSEL